MSKKASFDTQLFQELMANAGYKDVYTFTRAFNFRFPGSDIDVPEMMTAIKFGIMDREKLELMKDFFQLSSDRAHELILKDKAD